MSEHRHAKFVDGCFRCDVSRDEERRAAIQREVERQQWQAIKAATRPARTDLLGDTTE